jgi:hypothetical protein
LRGHSRVLVCASVLRTLPPAAPPASPVAPALAPARGMIGLSYTAAFFLVLVYTMDSHPTDKVEGVGDDFVRGGHDKTPTQKKHNSYERTVVKADTPTICPSVHLPNRSSPVATVSRRWPWRTATGTWPKQILPHPPTLSVLCTAPKARFVHFNIHDGFPTNRHTRSCVRGGTGDGRWRACGG